MEFTNFPEESYLTRRAQVFMSKPVEVPQFMDWDILEEVGLLKELQDKLCKVHKFGIVDNGILALYRVEEPIYKELVAEFLASFTFNRGPRDEGMNNRASIRFRLGGKWVHINLTTFGVMLDHILPNTNREIYRDHLDQSTTCNPPGYSPVNTWEEISLGTYDPSKPVEEQLRSPLHQIIFLCNATTILFHPDSETAAKEHLKGMHCALHREHRWHIPLIMATLFKSLATGEGDTLPLGHLITHFARKLGRLTPELIAKCAPPIFGERLGHDYMVKKKILRDLGEGRYELYRRDEESKEKISRESLNKKLDVLGKYLDELNKSMAEDHHLPLLKSYEDRLEELKHEMTNLAKMDDT